MKAIWDMDYDIRTDRNFQRPCCPECCEPIVLNKETGAYRCLNCGGTVEVDDPGMIKWFEDRSGIKQEYMTCEPKGCGKNTMLVTYRKNLVTLEWETMSGVCENCGARFIV